ncbi:DUF3500 domain-containing protein [Paenibacillus sp. B01]|uniref:DUF3500 domain-containing protein n=1 Tax=Paenibacillus sp. B01 TaxID=2660554 RepID=UPI001890BEC6|nr:DUF3500 domain-containing protein [Paenibacillus sp. B01]
MKQSRWRKTAAMAVLATGIGATLGGGYPGPEAQAAPAPALAPSLMAMAARAPHARNEMDGAAPSPQASNATAGKAARLDAPHQAAGAAPAPNAARLAPGAAAPGQAGKPAPPGGKSGLAVADAAVGQAMARPIASSAEARCPAQPTKPERPGEASQTDAPSRLVCLAVAFEATLTPPQREALRLPFTAKHAVSWSNRPVDEFPRNGIALGTLGEDSLEALKALLREALSESGYDTARGIILADDKMSSAAGGNPRWGSALYHVAFLGDPSSREPWMLQLSGRHLALNLASNTRETGVTPMFLGIEPRLFSAGGRDWAVMEPRLESMYAMLRSLPPDQMAAARLGDSHADVLLGPGKDGHFPEAEGIPYSHLGEQQKQRVRASIAAWVRTAAPASAQALLAAYLSPEALERTYIGWSGSTDDRVPGSYVRIDGPRLWLETVTLAEEALPGRGHVHTVWRDRKADYGGCFF